MTKWPEEVGSSREGIPGEVTVDTTGPGTPAFGVLWELGSKSEEKAQDFEPGASQGPLTARIPLHTAD